MNNIPRLAHTIRYAPYPGPRNGRPSGGRFMRGEAVLLFALEAAMLLGVFFLARPAEAATDLSAPTQETLLAETDRAALTALYEATEGGHWSDNTNRLSEEPLGD